MPSTTKRKAVSFRRAGEGPSLLLVHGLGSHRQVWQPLLPSLESRFDVINVDLPGHGHAPRLTPGSPATPEALAIKLATLLDDLDVDRPHVVGSSLGGWIALELAKAGRAESVTAFAPAGFWDDSLVPVIAHTNRLLARAVKPIAPTLLKSQTMRAVGFWTSSAAPAQLDAALTTEATAAHASASGWAAALLGTYRTNCDVHDLSPTVPVTIVWGDRDRILPKAHCQRPTRLPPHARWIRLSQCGHVPMWDQPQASIELIDETVGAADRKVQA